VTRAASREEVDVDQTVVAGLQSTFGANRFNALRVAWTQEDVAFANPNFNANGQRQDLLRPTLRHLSYVDQQSDVAQGRVNDAYQFEDTFSWFVPGWKGDHDIRLGVQYQYVDIQFDGQDNANGTFTFRSDAPFDAADPRTYPERLTIRVPGALAYGQKEHFFAAFLQDKWKLSRRLTLSLGVRYDLERIPIPERDNPRFASEDDYPVDAGDVSPRLGFAYDLTADGRTVVRGGYGRFFDKSHYELINAFVTSGVFSDSFIVQFPTSAADPGPSRGELPADPMLRGGPTVNRELLARQFPAGQRQRNRGNVFLDNPDRRVPRSDQLSLGVERALTRELSVSADYVHAFGRDQFMTQDLNPGVRRGTAATDVVDRRDPAFASSVLTRVNRGRLEFDALELQVEKRSSERYGFRISYTLSSARGNTGGNGAPQMQFQYLDELGLDRMDGPSDFDRRHNLVVSGVAEVPGTGGLTLSTVVRALSGLPFTVQDTNVDPDRNGILFDPLPAGPYSGSGAGAITVDSSGGRNGARGPSFFQADARVSYRFRFGERRLEVFGDIFNVTNRANFANPTGDRRSPNFLRVTALRDGGVPRTAQLGMRFEF